jgi:glucose-1-phosphate adenylyltransferase
MPAPENILAVILGGGVGKRLFPLTKQRSKPAVPMAGKYRLIDIPISNCLNSGITRIQILTQYNSVSLHRHITQTYNFDAFHTGWVEILAAEQTPTSKEWYMGTADAVRKQLFEIRTTRAEYVLILAGDHLYRMDYAELARFHWDRQADITVAVQPVSAVDSYRFGLLKRDQEQRIRSFVEKTRDPEVLAQFVSRDEPERPYLGSMGIYLFNTNVLMDLLENTTYDDFGGQIIPQSLSQYNVFGFDFDDYWEDIGTIRSFYETNLMLARPDPPFKLHDSTRPIYTHARFLPGSIINGTSMTNVLLSEGCFIHKATINESVVGLRSRISDGVFMNRTIMMGADYYDIDDTRIDGEIRLGVGANCHIEGAILDKNVRIGEGVVIKPFPPGTEIDDNNWSVRDGIVVIPKGTTLYPGTYIGPEERPV